MDEYLKCLYCYIIDSHRADTLLHSLEYQVRSQSAFRAWERLEDELSQAQLTAVDEYMSEYAQLSGLEKDWIFQEGVALGRWMARL